VNHFQRDARSALLNLVRKVFGRRVETTIQDVQSRQHKQIEAFLHDDFRSGNFNCGGKPDDDSIPSDAFGDW
jgi:hypothetical protein